VEFALVCPDCAEKNPLAEPDGNDLTLDPEYHQEVESLLELGQRVLDFAVARQRVGKFYPAAFFSALKRLIDAIRRQRQQLRQLYSVPAGKVRFIVDSCFS